MVITNADAFLESFATDATDEMKRYIWMNSHNEPAAIGNEKVYYSVKLMEKVEKIYIKTLDDKIISEDSQNKYIKDAKIKQVYNIKSSHLPMFTMTDELARILDEIIKE